MSSIVHHHDISVAGIQIATDQQGRFCLNDLHKAAVASGVTKDIRPNEWTDLDQTKALTEFLITENPAFLPMESRAGRYGGTYVCKELVYAYAMWISAKFHLQVIRTFDAVATGQLPAPEPKPTAIQPAKEFRALYGIARLIGMDKNAAAISANQGTAALTGTNMLQLMEATHLRAEKQELIFTPTELGKRYCLTGMQFNSRLRDAGLQVRVNDAWVPTDKGKQYSTVLDTGKKHGSGAPVQQVKWSDSVLGEVTI
jgi:hypothetical protein